MKIIIILSLIFILGCKKSSKSNDSIVSNKIQDVKNIRNKKQENVKAFEDCNETFEEFFEKFARDSVFQKNRVKYPLKLLYNDYEVDSVIVADRFTENNYRYFDFTKDKKAMEKESDKYTVEIEKLNNIVKYRHLGYDNGIMNTYTFKLISNCWYMVEILDEST